VAIRRLGLALLVATSADAAVGGTVRDAVTDDPLPGASIEIVGGGGATIADGLGRFVVGALPPCTLHISHVGYAPFEVRVDSTHVDIALVPAPVQMPETIVDGRDPAYDIMRRVAERKAEWSALLPDWRVETYTRQTLFAGTRILAIRESASELFHKRDVGIREQLTARRSSANVTDPLTVFPASAYLFDLYADEVNILGQTFPGPTAEGADRVYRFRLAGKEGELFHVAVQPRRDRPSFVGSVVVRDGEFSLVEARLRPNRRLPHPRFASASGFAYLLQQRYRRFEPGVWLPTEAVVEIEGDPGTSVGVRDVLAGPRPGRGLLRSETRFVRHEVAAASVRYAFMTDHVFRTLPPSPTWQRLLSQELPPPDPEQQLAFAELDRAVLPLARQPQSVLLRLHEHLPAAEVAVAIAEDPLDEGSLVSDEYLKKLIAGTTNIAVDSVLSPEGPVPVRGTFTSEIWVNRVDALHLGLRWRGQSLRGRRLGLYLKGGYNVGAGRPTYGLGLRRAWGKKGGVYAGLLYRAQTETRYPSSHYSMVHNSYPYLLNLDDYFDFYRSDGLRLEWGRYLDGSGLIEAGFNSERHTSLKKVTDRNLCDYQARDGRFYGWLCDETDAYRENPAIRPGRLHSFDARLQLQGTERLASLRVDGEYGARWMGGDFSFARLDAVADWRWLREDGPVFLPKSTTYRAQAGGALGEPPPQRHGTLDASLMALAPFGVFRALRNRPYEAEHYAALFAEWRWGDGLLRPLSPVFHPARWMVEQLIGRQTRWGLGWALHSAHGRTWLPRLDFEPRHAPAWHHEAGVSLTAFDALNVDMTWRLDERQRRVGLSFVRSF
jgi:hypothetical protein